MPPQFTLGGLMRLIVVVALGLVLVRWGLGALAFLLALLIGLTRWIGRVGRVTRVRAMLLVTAIYPWLFVVALTTCWVSAYLILGRTATYGDGRATLGLWVGFWEDSAALLFLGMPITLFAGIILVCWDVWESTDPAGTPNRSPFTLILAGPLLWGSAWLLVSVALDPAMGWLLD